MNSSTPLPCPFTIARDTREHVAPYEFKGLKSDADTQHRPLEIPFTWTTLKEGDYSIIGMEKLVSIERKTLSDLYGSLGQSRERFEREHERLSEFAFAAVVVESDWDSMVNTPPEYSKMKPKSVFRTAMSWPIKYGVHWMMCGVPREHPIEVAVMLNLFDENSENPLSEIIAVLEANKKRIQRATEADRAVRSRRLAEIITFRLLEKFWRDNHAA